MDMGHGERVAWRKAGSIDGWEVYKWERIGSDAVAYTGGIPRLLKRGPRKGQKTWRDAEGRTEIVLRSERDAEQSRYEHETGKCGECMGKGEEFAGWSKAEGTRTRPCRKCKGTGATQ